MEPARWNRGFIIPNEEWIRGIRIYERGKRIADEESSNDSSESGIYDNSTGDQLTKQDTPERQTLVAPLAPSDAKQWERSNFKITLKRRDFSVGMATVSRAFQVIYSKNKDPIILNYIYHGKRYPVKYLPHAKVFSGGWKQFVRENSFEEGDELVLRKRDDSTYEVSCGAADARNHHAQPSVGGDGRSPLRWSRTKPRTGTEEERAMGWCRSWTVGDRRCGCSRSGRCSGCGTG